MAKQIYILIFLLLLLIPLTTANLGTFKQNENVSIRVLANCSAVNLSEITLTNNNIVYVIDSSMTKLSGQTFNYTFRNTTLPGHYTYSWNNPCIDCSNGNCGNSFDITPNGNVSSTADSINMTWLIVILILAVICFMVMGIIFKIDSVKIFFFILAGLTLFLLTGLGLSTSQYYLDQFSQFGNIYSAYYIILAIVGGVGIIGLIVWFVYYTFSKFSKVKIGNLDNEDID